MKRNDLVHTLVSTGGDASDEPATLVWCLTINHALRSTDWSRREGATVTCLACLSEMVRLRGLLAGWKHVSPGVMNESAYERRRNK